MGDKESHGKVVKESLVSNVTLLVTCCDKNLCTKERLSRHRRWIKIPTGPSIISTLCHILAKDRFVVRLFKNEHSRVRDTVRLRACV